MEPVAGYKGSQYLSITEKSESESESDRVFGKNNRGRKVREEKSDKWLGITGRSDEAEPSYWSLCLSLCSFRRRGVDRVIEVVPEEAGASVMGINIDWTPEWQEALAFHDSNIIGFDGSQGSSRCLNRSLDSGEIDFNSVIDQFDKKLQKMEGVKVEEYLSTTGSEAAQNEITISSGSHQEPAGSDPVDMDKMIDGLSCSGESALSPASTKSSLHYEEDLQCDDIIEL